MAVLISLVALSIDAMLPALPAIGRDLGVDNPNDPQLILSVLFAGLAIGQLFYGPISDSTGRKPAIYAGLAIFLIGCVLTIFKIVVQGQEFLPTGAFESGVGAQNLFASDAEAPQIIVTVRSQWSGANSEESAAAVLGLVWHLY